MTNKAQPLPTDALAPCPFCGSHALLDAHADDCYFTLHSRLKKSGGDESLVLAAHTAWNRRTPAPVGVEPVARVNAEGFIVECGDLPLAPGLRLYTADQVLAMGRVPLNSDQRRALLDSVDHFNFPEDLIQATEEKHGIKQGGQHGAE